MRRQDREVLDQNKILDIIERCETLRLGLFGKEYPYVVPLSYGYEVIHNQIVFYVHGAHEGYKNQLIQKNNKVCVEMDLCHQFIQMGHQYSCEYESVIGFGFIQKVKDPIEIIKGLDLIMKHCGFQETTYPQKMVQATNVYKIIIDKMTGKHHISL